MGVVVSWIRPMPNVGTGVGTGVRPIPIPGGVRPTPGGVRPSFPVSPTYPGATTRPAAMEQGLAIARPKVTAKEAEAEAKRSRRKDCRCLPSVYCEGKPSLQYLTEGTNWVEYQLYIANMRASFAFEYTHRVLTEWEFGGDKRWDGFWQKSCTLLEMKGRYGFLANIKEGVLLKSRLESFIDGQFKSRNAIVQTHRKRATGKTINLQYHFKEEDVYKLFCRLVGNSKLAKLEKNDRITVHHTPFEDSQDRKERLKQEKKRQKEQKEFKQWCDDNPNLCA